MPNETTMPDRSARVTSEPESPPPQLLCPTCDRPLVYRQTVVGGVKPRERWDYFECRRCGPFVYRDRTLKLRRTILSPAATAGSLTAPCDRSRLPQCRVAANIRIGRSH